MGNLIKILLVSSIVLACSILYGCGNGKAIWKEITVFFKDDKLTTIDIRRRLSNEAITAIVDTDTINSVTRIRSFFNELGKSKDYSFGRSDSLLYIIFNRSDKVAGGPTIEVKRTGEEWYITDIRFGK